MGPEKLDVAVYYIRGLDDLADMAASKHDQATISGLGLAEATCGALRGDVVEPGVAAVRRLADRHGGAQLFQKYWIGQTPMEAEVGGSAWRRRARDDRARRPPHDEYSSDRPYNQGLFHTGRGGGDQGDSSCSR